MTEPSIIYATYIQLVPLFLYRGLLLLRRSNDMHILPPGQVATNDSVGRTETGRVPYLPSQSQY
ncbi:hypothetical protein BJX63DRAFT_398706 [Aspergillus granulosus]|uniref:Uncharacterized protein n=1 Tax=Aspergillus granulosus TaxID=176169 RepID=A0ABR4H8C6_9EURO